jgi:hypothetical protein
VSGTMWNWSNSLAHGLLSHSLRFGDFSGSACDFLI